MGVLLKNIRGAGLDIRRSSILITALGVETPSGQPASAPMIDFAKKTFPPEKFANLRFRVMDAALPILLELAATETTCRGWQWLHELCQRRFQRVATDPLQLAH